MDIDSANSKNLVIIGTGYVGLVSGACFAEIGHNVVCVDKDSGKIQTLENGEIPIYEPGLKAVVDRNVSARRLKFSTDLELDSADAVFLAVGTPTDPETQNADLTQFLAAAQEVADKLDHKVFVVTKSTVPVGTGAKLAEIFGDKADVISNPEFLREGQAVNDFMKPDRVVCGVSGDAAQSFMDELYKPLNAKMVFTSIATSELIKYAANSILAAKVVFINEMADLCEAVGADVQELANGIGLDERIGTRFLRAGPGIGGSCFPKDSRSLAVQAQNHGVPTKIIEALVESNENRKHKMAERIFEQVGAGAKVAIFGLTFKANTDDMRESPSLTIIPDLIEKGVEVVAYDPAGMEESKKFMPEIEYANSAEAAAEGADAVVILTEWDEFKNVDYNSLNLKRKLVMDLRNILEPKKLRDAGFEYISVGR